MPRLQLSEAEHAHIIKLRAKNAEVRGFNEGLDYAAAIVRNLQSPDHVDVVRTSVEDVAKSIERAKKPELLS